MEQQIPSNIMRLVRDRQALLWVCQRYDLHPGREPHDYGLSDAEATLLYRSSIEERDRKLSSLYWEAVWLEGARSPILMALREASAKLPQKERRGIVLLASEADADAKVASEEFLSVCSMPGVIDPDASPERRYGSLRARVRERIAWDLERRLVGYARRVLVVVGARTEGDLDRLAEVLEDCPLTDLCVLVVWPGPAATPQLPEMPAIQVSIWPGTEEEMVAALEKGGAPLSHELPKWAIRVGRQSIELPARDVQRIQKRFAILTERDLVPAPEFTMEDLVDFLEGDLANWRAYGAGLPVPRSYRTGQRLSFGEEVAATLQQIAQRADLRTFVLQLPCEPGAGGTTLLRAAAFEAAANGYPSLILRPDQVDLNLEDVHAFAGAIANACGATGIADVPPLAVFLDSEHAAMPNAGQLAQALASHGRKGLIVQAVPCDEALPERRARRSARLEPLVAKATEEEIKNCAEVFSRLTKRWELKVGVPSLGQWQAYERATQWADQSGSMFWVALRFFLTEEADLQAADLVGGALGQWIERRTAKIADGDMAVVLKFIAVLSSFRMLSPLSTVLRPVTGGVFTSNLVTVIKQLSGIVTWGDYVDELEDQVLRFMHPAQAEEYLRRRGLRTLPERLAALEPLLLCIAAGHPADVWVAEFLASTVLTPGFSERRDTRDWECRLRTFEQIPSVIRDQSKVILHHWARCLYLSVHPGGAPDIPHDERQSRLELAIDKLHSATKIAKRGASDEHPSHLYNTLGTAYARYANLLEESDPQRAKDAWDGACRAFQQAIALSGGANMDALLAFSRRLQIHAFGMSPRDEAAVTERDTSDVALSLCLLDQAEELMEESASPDPDWYYQIPEYRTKALDWLGSDKARGYVEQLREGANPELGYYCQARLALQTGTEVTGSANALRLLREAESQGVQLGWRSILLQITVMRRHGVERHSFDELSRLHQQLEKDPEYTPRPIDLFRHAVLCYQTGEHAEGAERFRKLREQIRGGGYVPLSLRDFWRDPASPDDPKVTQIRLDRITTEWRAQGYVDDLKQTVPLRPRNFTPEPKVREVVQCLIRFEAMGPLAVPLRFR